METSSYWTFLIYAAAVVLNAAGMLGFSALLGQRHREPATGDPYESGVLSTGSARLRVTIKFYLVAILFVIFDLEMVFIFAWAIALHDVGWPGYWGLVVFIGMLLAGLVYEWRMGALDWGSARPTRGAVQREAALPRV